jgi:hypothetical protein
MGSTGGGEARGAILRRGIVTWFDVAARMQPPLYVVCSCNSFTVQLLVVVVVVVVDELT